MANSLSSKKRIRQNEAARVRNRARKQVIKGEVRKFLDAVSAGDASAAQEHLVVVTKHLDQTAAKKTIHRNAAARKKSRLAKKLNALAAGKAG